MSEADVSDFPSVNEATQFTTWVAHGIRRGWLHKNALARLLDGSRRSIRIRRVPGLDDPDPE